MKLLSKLNSNNYRFERKFSISSMLPEQICVFVKRHPSMFYKAYPDRYINNIYFDTVDLANYWNNVDGNSQRMKIRIRWYNDLFTNISDPILEFKIKNNLLGTKFKYPLKAFNFDNNFNTELVRSRFAQLNAPANIIQYLLSSNITLMNRYHRQYFQSFDKRFRLTLDSQLDFFLSPKIIYTKPPRTYCRGLSIIEIKYNEKYDDRIDSISSFFPFRMTKLSKYILGMDSLYR